MLKFDKKYFDRVFTDEDPWRYSVSQYERVKYLRQIEAIRKFCPQPKSILEVGCAEGVFTAMLSETFSRTKITGVDISSTAIKRAIEKCKDCPNVEFLEGDAFELLCGGLPHDRRFDVIVQSESLYYMFVPLLFRRRLHSYLSGMASRLNDNGVFVTSNGITFWTRFILPVSYRILGKPCQPELVVRYREWNGLTGKRVHYDLRVFRR